MTQKEQAIKFLTLVIAGKIDEAFQDFVEMAGKHHNPFSPAGFAGLKQAMKDNDAQFPAKQLFMQHVLGEGDFVAVHSQLILRPGDLELAAVHLFRFAKGKIVELWDCAQAVPKDLPNTDGMF